MSGKKIKSGKEKLTALRQKMKAQKLDGFIVPRADEWQGEYVPARAARLAWLTGFTGSAGVAVILPKKAAVFSDERYTLQMDRQLDRGLYSAVTLAKGESFASWVCDHLSRGAKVGYDPMLHTIGAASGLSRALDAHKIKLTPVDENLLDAVWNDRPDHPDGKVEIYDDALAGQSSADKREQIAADLKQAGVRSFILTAPDSIAWLLNIRGTDVPHTPFALSYAFIHDTGKVEWFIPVDKVEQDVRDHIGRDVTCRDLADMPGALKTLAAKVTGGGTKKKIAADFSLCPDAFRMTLDKAGAALLDVRDPALLRKALKNDVEQHHIRQVHVQDGVALTKFWKWIDEEAPKGKLTELDGVAKLISLRGDRPGYRDESFAPIVGWAANGADIHYHATAQINARIKGNGLLLVDSGGQYQGGTTDNTRTWAVGTPTPEMRENFTLVLKGHIAVAMARFKPGTTGRDIDNLARHFLNRCKRDFAHGTGHGVGSYLSVHEDGAGISRAAMMELRPGMLISNEPGFYKVGQYGIRLENLVLVTEDQQAGKECGLSLCFNTVSLTPFDRRLIDMDLLDRHEIDWLDGYHAEIYNKIAPHLDKDEKAWLKTRTAPLRP